MSGPATLDDLRLMVQGMVRKIGRGFTSPTDDWLMVMVVQTPQGIDILGLTNELFANGVTKDALGEHLRRYVVTHGAYRYALLINGHGVMYPLDDDGNPKDDVWQETMERVRREEVRIEQLEGAYEQLTLNVGDAEEEQVWTARIVRNARMIRVLEPWENFTEGDPTASVSGRFFGLNRYLSRPR